MSYFEFTVNNNDKIFVGNENLKYLSFGLISVGPKFEMIMLSNSMHSGEKKAINLLNKALFVGDEINVQFREEKPANANMADAEYNEEELKNGLNSCNKIQISLDDDKKYYLMAENETTLSINFDWLRKDNICWLSLGILGENGNEQWMKMSIKPDEVYTFKIG